jgi:ribonucleoside-diphosphate reductase beta chain
MPINFESLPLREIRKGRSLAWDPFTIDFSRDKADWAALDTAEQEFLLRQIVGFLIGERGVTHDLAPLQQTLRREKGRMEEEMYLTQQLYEESTHIEFFQRWMNDVLPGVVGKDIPFPPGQGNFFSEILPDAMQALNTDASPEAQMRATVTYHQIVEGVLAEVGYAIFYACLDAKGILPGLRFGLRQIQQDESRHIAFGTFLAQRLINEHPELERVFEECMESLHDATVGSTDGFFGPYGLQTPFGVKHADFKQLAEDLYQRRIRAVLKGGLVKA